jgi:F5/8 type C domain
VDTGGDDANGSVAGGGSTSSGASTTGGGVPMAGGSAGSGPNGGVTNGGVAFGGQAGVGGVVTFAGSPADSAGAPGDEGTAGEVGEGGTGVVPQPVELAHDRPVTASSSQDGHQAALGNDGVTTTRWCAVDGTYPQSWRVDLGSAHLLSHFTVRWELAAREYSYRVETSSDDKVFTTLVTSSVTGTLQTADFPPDTHARYVQIVVTNIVPHEWASFYELSVFGF